MAGDGRTIRRVFAKIHQAINTIFLPSEVVNWCLVRFYQNRGLSRMFFFFFNNLSLWDKR